MRSIRSLEGASWMSAWPRPPSRWSGSRSRWPGAVSCWVGPNSPGPCSGDAVPAEHASLDQARWIGLWSRLGAQGGGLSIFSHLVAAYAEPARAYHTAAHIIDCLAQLDLSQPRSGRVDEVEAAIWFHDAVYVPGGSENEDRSAHLAQTALLACAGPADTSRRI